MFTNGELVLEAVPTAGRESSPPSPPKLGKTEYTPVLRGGHTTMNNGNSRYCTVNKKQWGPTIVPSY